MTPFDWPDDLAREGNEAAKEERQDPGQQGQGTAARNARESQATQLVRLAQRAGAEFWHDLDGQGWVTFNPGGHYENHSLNSKGAHAWLRGLFYRDTRKAPGEQGVQDALAVLSGQAQFEGAEHQVWVRVAEHEGAIYIDLCDKAWRTIAITVSGWRIVETPPVRFRRPKGMLPLPVPVSGGSLEELLPLLNTDAADWPLVKAWLVTAFNPSIPCPVLLLLGEQGSAKSTAGRLLRALIDPSTSPLRSEPRDQRDLAIAANNSRVVAFDNLSRLPVWLSDALCRLSTGGGFATRELYSDMEEAIFNARRPVLITGIEDVVERGDLQDRYLPIDQPVIPDGQRRTEEELMATFNEAAPGILGALLDATACGLRRQHGVQREGLPRMADFAVWAIAAGPALGLEEGVFLAAYRRTIQQGHETAIELHSAGPWFLAIAETGFEGTAAQLLARATYLELHRKDFPQTPRAMSGTLRRLAPNLRRVGVEVTFRREAGGIRKRMIGIKKMRVSTVPTDPSVPQDKEVRDSRDANAQEWDAKSAPSPTAQTLWDGWDAGDADFPTESSCTHSAEGEPATAQPEDDDWEVGII